MRRSVVRRRSSGVGGRATYDIEVLHGPFELGPQLVENSLYEALPAGVNMLTIQDHGSFSSYSGSGHAYDRGAPAFCWKTTNGKLWPRHS